MSEKIIRVLVEPFEPIVSPCVQKARNFSTLPSNCGGGFATQIFSLVARSFENESPLHRFEFVNLPTENSSLSTFERTVRSLNEDKSDVTLDAWTITADRANNVSFTTYVLHAEIACIVSRSISVPQSGHLALFPFDLYVATVFVLLTVFMTVVLSLGKHNLEFNLRRLKETAWEVFRSVMNQDAELTSDKIGFAWLQIVWYMLLFMFYTMYGNFLTTHLLHVKAPPFYTYGQLLNLASAGHLRLVDVQGYATIESLLSSASRTAVNAGKKAVPVDAPKDILPAMAQDERLVFPAYDIVAPYFAQGDCERFAIVRLRRVSNIYMGLMVRKNSPYLQSFDKHISRFQGQVQHMTRVGVKQECHPITHETFNTKLSWSHIRTVCILHVVGCALSIILLMLEHLTYRRKLSKWRALTYS